MAKDPEWMTEREVLEHVMRVTGKTKRQARYALLKELRAGHISAKGDNIETGKQEYIPRDYWPSVN